MDHLRDENFDSAYSLLKKAEDVLAQQSTSPQLT
jgi:hypothetical protein